MNLHVLDENPKVIAMLLDDKRVGKMLMETNQMLSLAVKHYMRIAGANYTSETGEGMLTAGWSHYNHPVSIWVRQTSGNFDFTLRYAFCLAREFAFRFNKEHASGQRTHHIKRLASYIPSGPMTPFQNSARHNSRDLDFTGYPVIEAYRRYMLSRWEDDVLPPKWTGRSDASEIFKGLYLQ